MAVEEFCAFTECEKPAFADGLCIGHFRQKQRHGRVTGPVAEGNPGVCPREAAFEKVIDSFGALQLAAEADDPGAYHAARQRFRHWAARWLDPRTGKKFKATGRRA